MSYAHPVGVVADPIGAETYKRAVYRQPPPQFAVEMLGAAKQGGGHSYGMRIHPVINGDRQSMSSQRSHTEYDIWRRWEDCLFFQSTLETEYRQRARAKRQRLARGKGVKRNGFYLQDQASSWESLPPGPDPNSVGREINEYLPTLTKKNTVFRANQATIDQRAAELKALIEGLFKPDVPALIDELRAERTFLDFFGYWRRDMELAGKDKKQKASSPKPRTSISSSIFSNYFSSSNVNLSKAKYTESIASSNSSKSSGTYRAPSGIAPSISDSARTWRNSSDSSDGSSSIVPGRRRAYSTGSSGYTPSTPSDGSLESPVNAPITIPDIVEDTVPLSFNHDPHSRSASYADEHSMYDLSVLPEDRELSFKDEQTSASPSRRRRTTSTGESVRNGMIFLTPPQVPTIQTPTADRTSGDRSIRESWQTIDSAACMLEGMHLTIPPSPTEVSHRASISSIATFRTDCSVEGVLPRAPFDPTPSPRRSPGGRSRASRVVSCPISISEFEEEWSDPEDDILDGMLAESFPMPSFDAPQDIIFEELPKSALQFSDNQSTPSLPSFPSPAKSAAFSDISRVSGPQQLTIKAGYNDAFIVLRVSPEISYKDLRHRLYNKFVGVEGIPLSEKFDISFVQPVTADNTLDHSTANNTETNALYPVTSEGDWECVAASIDGNKLTLRIFDPTS